MYYNVNHGQFTLHLEIMVCKGECKAKVRERSASGHLEGPNYSMPSKFPESEGSNAGLLDEKTDNK